MGEGWYIKDEQQLNALIDHCRKALENGEHLHFAVQRPDKRTDRQNRAIWKACEMLGKALNDAGMDMKSFPWKQGVDVPWDKESVKKRLFDPIMIATTEKTSSRSLKKTEVSQVWDTLIRHLGNVAGVSMPFPSWEHYYEKHNTARQQ